MKLSEDQKAAHAFLAHLNTRVAAQEIHSRAGDEESAAISVYKLFGIARSLMADHPEAERFAELTTVFLNSLLRSYTTRWHGWLTLDTGQRDESGRPELKFETPAVRQEFRLELRELRSDSQKFIDAFKSIRKGTPWSSSRVQKLGLSVTHPKDANLGESFEAGLRTDVEMLDATTQDRSIVGKIDSAEHGYIQKRRSLLRPEEPSDPRTPPADVFGLALSGGGIRSATFCLGVVQTLYAKGLFQQVDYLSTVSGGGYLGSFLSSMLSGDVQEETKAQSAHVASTERADSEPGEGEEPSVEGIAERLKQTFEESGALGSDSEPVRYLRNNSKYLSNWGFWGRITMAGLLVTGFLTSTLILLTLPLAMVWLLIGIDCIGFYGVWGMTLAKTFAVLTLVFWVLLPILQRVGHGAAPGSRKASIKAGVEQGTLVLALGSVLLFSTVYAPWLVQAYERFRLWVISATGSLNWSPSEGVVIALISASPILLGFLARKKDGGIRGWVSWAFALVGPAFFVFAFLIFSKALGFGSKEGVLPSGLQLVMSLGFFVWVWLFINVNIFSPHTYYRNRLCECYLAVFGKSEKGWILRVFRFLYRGVPFPKGGEAVQGVGTLQRFPLKDIGENYVAPYHIINTTLNAEASPNPELRGRDGDFFLISKYFCGSPLTGYLETEELVSRDLHLDLGTAMAISGAAASSNMGWKTMRKYRFLMTAFNIRLGYWVPNPKNLPLKWPLACPGPYYLLRELFGGVHENGSYVNLSDGGHIENLAAYELLRRQNRFIVCVDAGVEPGMECSDLMRLQEYASIDFGIHMEFDTSDLKLLDTGHTRAYGVLVKINYTPTEPEPKLGWMLYLKLSMTGIEEPYVQEYKRQNPTFPHQTTADQWYDEAQFEAYRCLGSTAAESMFMISDSEAVKAKYADGVDSGEGVKKAKKGKAAKKVNSAKSHKSTTGAEAPRKGATAGEIPGESRNVQWRVHGWFQHLADRLLDDNCSVFDAAKRESAASQAKTGSRKSK